jgi:hypothetical protein
MTTAFLNCCLYLAALVFVVACVVRALPYARMPLHLRWELYPVPHEEAARVEHGGSYFDPNPIKRVCSKMFTVIYRTAILQPERDLSSHQNRSELIP